MAASAGTGESGKSRGGRGAGALHPDVAALLRRLQAALVAAGRGEGPAEPVDLQALAEETRSLLLRILGEGTVEANLLAPPAARIRETLYSGLWLVRTLDESGSVSAERIEIGPFPVTLANAAHALAGRPPADLPVGAGPGAIAVHNDVRNRLRAWRPDRGAQVINISLLPLKAPDRICLEGAYGGGDIHVGIGGQVRCNVDGTGVFGLWRVRFLDPFGKAILDNLEIAEIPQIIAATADDMGYAADRMVGVIDWLVSGGDEDEL